MIALKPLPGRVLVELREKYQHVATADQKYDTKTSGILLKYCATFTREDKELWSNVKSYTDYWDSIVGKLIFWEEYKDGAVIERDGRKYAFIKIEDLDGYEDVESK